MKTLGFKSLRLKTLGLRTSGLIIIFLCLALSGCELFGPDIPDQKYLFDVYYVNNAWGFILHGTYIDRNGDVFSYQVSPKDSLNWDSLRIFHTHGKIVDEEYLNKRYSFNRQFIKHIDPSVVRKKLVELYSVPLKAYSDTLGTGADMGAFVHSGFLYYDQNRTYREVELKVTGDITYYNTSETAAGLVRWLDSELNLPEDPFKGTQTDK